MGDYVSGCRIEGHTYACGGAVWVGCFLLAKEWVTSSRWTFRSGIFAVTGESYY